MKSSDSISIIYHSFFSFHLSKKNLHRWTAGDKLTLRTGSVTPHLSPLSKGEQNKLDAIQKQKLLIARKAANLLSHIPTILFVGVTGSLAMENAKETSDIDFMIITSAHSLWITRAISLLLLLVSGVKMRRAFMKDEKDRICLNVWLDEKSLGLPCMPRNAYTAHEVAQVIPLINKRNTFEKWLFSNKWVLSYWPNAITIRRTKAFDSQSLLFLFIPLNVLAYYFQVIYMNHKVTREVFSFHFAYFHPFDWGDVVMKRLEKNGVISV
ncbi:nucleotidyltransferase domain-containing protein [Candidatus Woesebacteria bacterium]|nr:nucleotidyltransferase domain-containing protein [Candidatus Woesebacteria bacterium]